MVYISLNINVQLPQTFYEQIITEEKTTLKTIANYVFFVFKIVF